MKKLLTVCGLALIGLQNVTAQTEDTWMPKQLGIGVGVGTTGIVIDASTTLNRWLGIRAGVDIMPKIKVNTDLDLETQDKNKSFQDMTNRANEINNEWRKAGHGDDLIDLSGLPDGLPENMDVQGKLTNTTFHFLVDVYPFKHSSFHATAGFYAGGKEFVSVYNKTEGFLTPVTQWNSVINGEVDNLPETALQYIKGQEMIGAELGDYFITPNPANNGNVKATVEVNAFRPYLGIGFGRAVPRKKRIGCQFDLGVQFWGTPKVYAPTYNKETGYLNERLTEEHAGGDGSDIIKIISSIPVYPTLNFRLVGRIF